MLNPPFRRSTKASRLATLAAVAIASTSHAQILLASKISDLAGGFAGTLSDSDQLGSGVTLAGDLDGDLVPDLVLGARGDQGGGLVRGAVWTLLMNADGTVKAEQRIAQGVGGFTGVLGDLAFFGSAVTSLGDVDGDGVPDVAVGAPGFSFFNPNGAVWVLFLNASGTVKAHQKIGVGAGGFTGALAADDRFGSGLAALGDLDGDGVVDLAVGAPGDQGGAGLGAVWVLFLNANGTVKAQQRIGAGAGGFGCVMSGLDSFGASVGAIGDLDGDGLQELAVGAPESPIGTTGSVWILFLAADGTVRAEQKIAQGTGGFSGTAPGFDAFGTAVARAGDHNADGVPDVAVGAQVDSAWILFLQIDGSVLGHTLLAEPGLTGGFASALAPLGDHDGNGTADLLVGAPLDGDGGFEHGAVWTVLLGDADCNGNGVDDAQDIALGTSADCDGNGVPDECQLAAGQDCNGNGLLDGCEPDCNGNGIPDDCEVLGGGVTVYGAGSAGSFGLPSLCPLGTAVAGAPFTLAASALPGGGTAVFLLSTGATAQPLDLSSGLLLNVALPLLLLSPVVANPSGEAQLTLPLPLGAAGLSLCFQLISLDPTPIGNFASSLGVQADVF